MLAGCSGSTLLSSPRHRLRSEASAQFHPCHFQLPSMSTQRLDFPCSLSRKDTKPLEKKLEGKPTSSCSIKQNIRLPPLATTTQATPCRTAFIEGRKDIEEDFWDKSKSLKRYAEQGSVEDSIGNRAKRKKGSSDHGNGNSKSDDIMEGRESLSLSQLGTGNFWFQPVFEVPRSIQSITGFNPPLLHFSPTCSRDEERVSFVPAEVISPPLPLSNNPWFDSVVTEITDLGEKDGETSHHRSVKEASGSSNSSESQRLVLRLNEKAEPEHEVGNGSRSPNPREVTELETGEDDEQEERKGFELVSLLAACVEAIGSRDVTAVHHCIARLGDLASPRGTSIRRLSAYFTEALAIRVTRLWPHLFRITIPREIDRVEDDSGTTLRLLNQVTPILKFLHFTSNEILLRAFEGKDRVHIIDFDIKQGLQWPSLFQSLASRPNPPSHVRITGIGESKQDLNETGDRLAEFAETLNLPFEFHQVVDRLEDVRLWMLHVKEQESVAVNCVFQLHKTLYDGNGAALRDFLGLIRSINSIVMVMAEQEAEHNDLRLETRFINSFKYYSALFDAIGYSLPLESPVRTKIEEMFAKEIRNVIACEGSDRLERHGRFEKWRRLMEHQGGFRNFGVTEREMAQSQLLLKMHNTCENYKVKKQGREEMAALTLSWSDQPLYTVSAWTPVDVEGSSSSYSQPS